MTLRSFLRAGHPMFRGQDKQVCQPEAFKFGHLYHLDVRAVHPVIVDDVLAFEDHLAARFQHAIRFADCVVIVFLKLLVSVVAAEARSHCHLAIVLAPVSHIGQERRIEHHII